MVKVENDHHGQYYQTSDIEKRHSKSYSTDTEKGNSNQRVLSIPNSPISNRKDSLNNFQLQFADHQGTQSLGSNTGNQTQMRNYSLYPPNQPTSPTDYGMRSGQFQSGQSQVALHGLGIMPPGSTTMVHGNNFVKTPSGIPGGYSNQQNFSFPDTQSTINQPSPLQTFDQGFGHRRGDSGNSFESRSGLNDLWTPNTAFSFPPKSPMEPQRQQQFTQTAPTALENPHKRVKSADKVSKVSKHSPQKSLSTPFPQHRTSFPVQHSSVRSFSAEEAQRQYLDFYGNALHVLRGLMGLESVCDDMNRFTHFIKNDEQMRKFMAMERQKEAIGVIDPDSYSVDEFYKYLRMFPTSELINLRGIFHSSKMIIDDWLKIEEEQERVQIPLNKWINLSNSGEFSMNHLLSLDFDDSLIHGETSALRSSVLKPYHKWSGDNTIVPGESVSMQVDPIKATEYINQAVLYPKGKLQRDLSYKIKTVCLQCGSDKTPEWRKGPERVRTLCNACGLFYNKLTKKYGVIEAEAELQRRKRDGEPTNRKLYLQTDSN